MKLPQTFRKLSTQTRMMILVIVLLLVMIATRWAYTSKHVGDAFYRRFVPKTEQTQPDSLR